MKTSKLVMPEKQAGSRRKARQKPLSPDSEIAVPTFESEAELEAWWDAWPRVEIEFDERLKKQVDMAIRLNQRVVEGLDHLAREKGIRRESLVRLIIDDYLNNHLPPDF